MTRKTHLIACVVFLLAGLARAQSYIVYTLETGGDNHTAAWENNTFAAFTSGVTDGSTMIMQGADLTWAVRVSVGGIHQDPGGPGDGKAPLGAANLVFDLEVRDSTGTLVSFGAAPMTCSTGVPNVEFPKQCKPMGPGFWSSINDGDADGNRGSTYGIDDWANAAFTISLYNTATPPAQLRALNDPADAPGLGGPNFDYGWFPTANGRSGIPITGGMPRTDLTTASLTGKLVGFGAGYKSYDGTNYSAGVGVPFTTGNPSYGFGASIGPDPQNPVGNERPLFEGQINTSGLPHGTYYIKVLPAQTGNNILHGDVQYGATPGDYGGFGSFATKANNTVMVASQSALPNGVPLVVAGCCVPQPWISARRLFYNNSWYDGNNAGIDAVTTGKCDSNAIDNGATLYGTVYPAKAPLMLGGGTATFANYTGYNKGINGLIYDVVYAGTPRDPQVGDFTFHNIGKAGTTSPGTVVTPSGFGTIVISTNPRTVRVGIAFADNAVKDTWLRVDVGTGFGTAWGETHFWGNAAGDTGTGNGTGTQWMNILVGPPDELAARAHPTTALNRSVPGDPFDINKDSLVNPADQLWIRGNVKTPLTCVKLIVK